MSKVIIRNLGPIKDITLDLNKINVRKVAEKVLLQRLSDFARG
jgi:predicted DNA binding CopG/RHH family protein